MSSRLALDSSGRLICVQTTPELGIRTGTRFRVMGDTVEAAGVRVYFLARERGRVATPRERGEARPPYDPGARTRRERAQFVDDDQLAEGAAIELARLEQQRQPADLIGAALSG